MKKIINAPETIVQEMCSGIAAAHPSIQYLPGAKVLKKRNINKNKVSLISGGGCGHEPAHAGFVGTGMLDAAVCGDVFASPSQIQVYKAIQATASDKGTLLIIKNYSGDVMNFKNAAYLAQEDGITVDYVKVDDDIAVEDSLYTVGHRGVAGTVLVHKIAGAAAEAGADLAEVKRIANKTIENVKSIGFALSSCTVPAKGSPTFSLEEGEMEYGVGIHGEPGIRRAPMQTASELAKSMSDSLAQSLSLIEGDEVALLVNGFGATPLQELYLLNHAVLGVLTEKKLVVSRQFVGNYMTSIDMAGASITLLKLDSELKSYLCAPCEAPSFFVSGKEMDCVPQEKIAAVNQTQVQETVDSTSNGVVERNVISLDNLVYLVEKMGEIIIENEVPFCDLDSHAGDGDFGMSVAKGFKMLKEQWNSIEKSSTMGCFLDDCAMIIMEHCGGASGPIWGSAFRAAGKYASEKSTLSVAEFAGLMQAAVHGIQSVGERSFGRGAVVGDKTLIDALVPCADTWSAAPVDADILAIFADAAAATVAGAKATEAIVARMGRAGTVGERSIGYPDAGAFALGEIFTALSLSLMQA